MKNEKRRRVLATITDAIMDYWRGGLEHDEMVEFWTSDEAPQVAGELAGFICTALDDKGLLK